VLGCCSVGGTLFASHMTQASADINSSSNAITMTTGSNQNITLTPNGTGATRINGASGIDLNGVCSILLGAASHANFSIDGSVNNSNVHMGNSYHNTIRYQGDSSLVATLTSGKMTFASGIGMPNGAAITYGTNGNITNTSNGGW